MLTRFCPTGARFPSRRSRFNRPRRLAAFLTCFTFATFLWSCGAVSGNSGTDLQGHLSIKGSTAMLPLVSAAATLFEHDHPLVQIAVQGGGSLLGLHAVTAHQIDIGDSDIVADPATFPDPALTDHVICIIPFTMVVGPGVTIASLTRQQLVDIFATGTLRNWQQVGGSHLPIVPIVRPATSGTRAIFRQNILGGRDEHGHLLTSDSSQAVSDAVAYTPGAIGYLALPFLNASVRAIALDGQRPQASSIETSHYAFWGYEHMYTMGNQSPLLAAFITFLLSSQRHHLMQHLLYIPLPQLTTVSQEDQRVLVFKANPRQGEAFL